MEVEAIWFSFACEDDGIRGTGRCSTRSRIHRVQVHVPNGVKISAVWIRVPHASPEDVDTIKIGNVDGVGIIESLTSGARKIGHFDGSCRLGFSIEYEYLIFPMGNGV